MTNILLTIGCVTVLVCWGIAGVYFSYITIRDDRRNELKRKMDEKDELERKIRCQIRDEYWLEEQSRKLREAELKKRFDTISE